MSPFETTSASGLSGSWNQRVASAIAAAAFGGTLRICGAKPCRPIASR